MVRLTFGEVASPPAQLLSRENCAENVVHDLFLLDLLSVLVKISIFLHFTFHLKYSTQMFDAGKKHFVFIRNSTARKRFMRNLTVCRVRSAVRLQCCSTGCSFYC